MSQEVITETKSWCNLNCEYSKEHLPNANLIHLRMENDSVMNALNTNMTIKFPIRFAFVQEDTTSLRISELEIRTAINNLNESFLSAGLSFYLNQIDIIKSKIKLENLSKNTFNTYDKFSKEHDLDNTITIYVLDHAEDFCIISDNSISCNRTGGFSYILSDLTNNIVMSRFDITDQKILAHEFGHFFGLYHTFEKSLFGPESFDSEECYHTGDRLCDTPPDPGAALKYTLTTLTARW